MLKKDNISGSIEWDGVDPNYLLLKNIPKSVKVVMGDSVLTSTYSANFPSHLLIGTVNSVVVDPSSNFYTLKVKTATNFFSIQYVYLVENLRYTEQVKIEVTPEKN
jgi:rod shape-determining protein MreC